MTSTTPRKVRVPDLALMKQRGDRIVMLTAYDATMARLLDRAGIDLLLVGDSLGNVIMGLDTTIPVTLDVMIHHTRAVVRGTNRALVVADMPFRIKFSRSLLRKKTKKIVGQNEQNKQNRRKRIWDYQLKTFCKFCSFCLRIPSPPVGIGAGSHCDGQVLVSYDVLGLFDTFAPPFAKQYAQLGQVIVRAAKDYANDVREGLFPKSTLSNQQTRDLAGRRVIPSLNDRAFEELKGARVPVR